MRAVSGLALIATAVAFAACSGLVSVYRGPDTGEDIGKQITRVEVQEVERPRLERLASEIRAFLGTPYHWGGTSVRGVDCSGLVQTVFQRVYGVSLPRTTEELYQSGVQLHETPLRLGDLVFFSNGHRREVSHVGIYLGEGKFVHASTSRGVLVSDLRERYYRRHFAGARRVLNFASEEPSDE